MPAVRATRYKPATHLTSKGATYDVVDVQHSARPSPHRNLAPVKHIKHIAHNARALLAYEFPDWMLKREYRSPTHSDRSPFFLLLDNGNRWSAIATLQPHVPPAVGREPATRDLLLGERSMDVCLSAVDIVVVESSTADNNDCFISAAIV